MYRANSVCGATHVTIAALFCGSSLLRSSNCDWAGEYEAGQSVSANGNEESAGKNCHRYILVVNAITPYSCTIKLQYTLLGDYWVCVRPARLPVLTWVPSSVPPGNNIQDTFLIGSATDTTYCHEAAVTSVTTELLTRATNSLQLKFQITTGCWYGGPRSNV